MDDKERYQSGADARRKILGDAWVDRADGSKTAFTAEWQDFITRCAWGEVWTRPHFEERTRRILVIGTMNSTYSCARRYQALALPENFP